MGWGWGSGLRRVPEFAFGFLVATAIGAVALLFLTDSQTYQKICETNQYSGKESCAAHNILYVVSWYLGSWFNASAAIITAVATGFIAWFTLTLKRSTDKLWDAGERQLNAIRENADRHFRDMAASIAVAERSAKAAESAAEAATLNARVGIQLQLPVLIVRSMGLYLPGQPYGTNEPYTVSIHGGVPPEWSQVAIQIGNTGKTAAAATEQCVEQCLGAKLPEIPQFKTIIPMPVGEVMEADDGYVTLHVRNHFIHLLPQYREQMRDPMSGLRLWIYGFVRYTDFLGKPHEFRFCKRWIAYQYPGGPPGGFVSDSDTPAEYTRSY